MVIGRLLSPVHSLGPGERVCLWTQGCSKKCVGCISPDLQGTLGTKIDNVKLSQLIIQVAEKGSCTGLNHCISHWLSNTEGIKVDDETLRLVDAIEAVSATEPEIACYWFGNSFAPEKMLQICNKRVSSIEELIEALFVSPNDFYQTDGYKKLLSRVDGADLYGFLFSFGYKEAVDNCALKFLIRK